MSTTTNNYGFVKPELTDSADITSTNENWDKVDEELNNKVSKNENNISLKDGHGGIYTSDQHWLEIFSNLVPHDESNRVGVRLQSDIDLKDSLKFYKQTNGAKVYYDIHGGHNKPLGSYTGTGANRKVIVSLNLITSRVMFITATSCNLFVTSRGAIGFSNVTGTSGSQVQTFNSDTIYFSNGVLNINGDSANSFFNANGTNYEYQVL